MKQPNPHAYNAKEKCMAGVLLAICVTSAVTLGAILTGKLPAHKENDQGVQR